MTRNPSDYEATVDLSYSEMWELQKAIGQRIGSLIEAGDLDSDEARLLTQVSNLLEVHIDRAVGQWESEN